MQSLKHGLEATQSGDQVEIVQTGCMGLCSRGPLVRVEEKQQEPVLYGNVSAEVAQQIVARYVPVNAPEESVEVDEDEQRTRSS